MAPTKINTSSTCGDSRIGHLHERQLPAITQSDGLSSRGVRALPALVTTAGVRAGKRFLEFFAANIRNPHTRRGYARAAEGFLGWCANAGVPSIAAVQPVQSRHGSGREC